MSSTRPRAFLIMPFNDDLAWLRTIVDADRPLRTLCAVATAAIEGDAQPLLQRCIGELVDLFEVTPSNGSTWLIYLPQLAAQLACYLLIARAIALSNWPALGVIGDHELTTSRGEAHPWVVDRRFAFPESLGGDAALVGTLDKEFASADPVWEPLKVAAGDVPLVADANFLVSS